MRVFGGPSRTSRWRDAGRIAVMLLLGAIVSDLPDAFCDPLPLSQDDHSLAIPQPAEADACGEVCVPDCFCCSTTVPADQPMSIERPDPPAEKQPSSILSVATGFSSLPEHVPIASR